MTIGNEMILTFKVNHMLHRNVWKPAMGSITKITREDAIVITCSSAYNLCGHFTVWG